jgi:hypothetical protein
VLAELRNQQPKYVTRKPCQDYNRCSVVDAVVMMQPSPPSSLLREYSSIASVLSNFFFSFAPANHWTITVEQVYASCSSRFLY